MSRLELGDRCAIVPAGEILLGGASLGLLRRTREVALPEGLETVGEFLFAKSAVEVVWVPASVW